MTIGDADLGVMDGRDAMLAVGMNDEPLPLAHGFPVRMLVPGLYGYVSATKWLVDLEATTFADYDRRTGCSASGRRRAAVRLESRIDTAGVRSEPADSSEQTRRTIAGIAWHQHVGVSRGPGEDRRRGPGRRPGWAVSRRRTPGCSGCSVDGEPARLGDVAGPRGGQGRQRAGREPAGVFPSGASGWHSIVVSVQ